MSTRIAHAFARAKQESRAALVTFIMGGDPDRALSQQILNGLPAAGADIIELGVPFSDPMADGPAIQAAGLRALKAGATLEKLLAMAAEFRKCNDATPLLLMGYYNSFYKYGVARFAKDAQASGIDGVIIVDLPWEEEGECKPILTDHGIEMIRLIAPTTPEARLANLLKEARGFVYYIAVAGITGTRSAAPGDLAAPLQRIRRHTDAPVAVGFGIRNAAQAAEVAVHADGIVVGSAIVEIAGRAEKNSVVKETHDLVKSLSTACADPRRRAG